VKNAAGQTPLVYATQVKQEEIATLLRESGAA
jgi:hypothetical protein